MTIISAPSIPAIRELLGASDLPSSDIENPGIDFLALGDSDDLQGVVGLEAYGTAGLLRSLAVQASQRGAGHGRALVEAIESRAAGRGVRTMYLLTTTAEDFFARLGYRKADRSSAPVAIQKTREFAGLCPSTATFMMKDLPAAVTGPKH